MGASYPVSTSYDDAGEPLSLTYPDGAVATTSYSQGSLGWLAGVTWTQPRAGLDRHYGWAVAADCEHPEVWYASLSPGPAH